MTARKKAAHHRLGDAGGERHRDDGIRRGSAVREDLGAHVCSGGMTRRNSGFHRRILPGCLGRGGGRLQGCWRARSLREQIPGVSESAA